MERDSHTSGIFFNSERKFFFHMFSVLGWVRLFDYILLLYDIVKIIVLKIKVREEKYRKRNDESVRSQ